MTDVTVAADDALAQRVALLRAGGVLACPTETLMGLLADALNPAAVERVVAMKRRPPGEPIALLIPNADALSQVSTGVSGASMALARQHWPGPLTLLVPAAPALCATLVLDGCVGVRVPGPSPALDLVRAFGGPLTATSANLSGQPPVRDGAEAQAVFGEQLASTVPGTCPGGLPSTIVDARGPTPRVIRAGAVPLRVSTDG